MTAESSTYRWNTSAAAEAYDAAAPTIHPYYTVVQDHILDSIPFEVDGPFSLVDLGGGSGRLADRVLERFVGAHVTVVDQSEPFLALAERKLARFGARATFVQCRLQDEWEAKLPSAPNVIVSTSAIHHLEPREKRDLYARCFAALAPGGVFINGDEYRPADDGEFLALIKEWSAHMTSALTEGRIPESFQATLDHWHKRNIVEFGEPKKSGDDCQETIAVQIGYLREAGFARVATVWAEKLWGVVAASKIA
jgi:tRNA (cmo5U34)-methyltransferase